MPLTTDIWQELKYFKFISKNFQAEYNKYDAIFRYSRGYSFDLERGYRKRLCATPYMALEYAKHLAEEKEKIPQYVVDLIAQLCTTSYRYAVDVLHGPFPEGEPAIAKFARYSSGYAIHVLKGRFPAGEDKMVDDGYEWNWYVSFLDSRKIAHPSEMDVTIARLKNQLAKRDINGLNFNSLLHHIEHFPELKEKVYKQLTKEEIEEVEKLPALWDQMRNNANEK